jgi:hypothetical protein
MTTTHTDPDVTEPSELDAAVNAAHAEYDQLLTHVAKIDDAARSQHWTQIAAAEQRCADARRARGDIGDYLAADDLSDMVAHSLSMAASYAGFAKAVAS